MPKMNALSDTNRLLISHSKDQDQPAKRSRANDKEIKTKLAETRRKVSVSNEYTGPIKHNKPEISGIFEKNLPGV